MNWDARYRAREDRRGRFRASDFASLAYLNFAREVTEDASQFGRTVKIDPRGGCFCVAISRRLWHEKTMVEMLLSRVEFELGSFFLLEREGKALVVLGELEGIGEYVDLSTVRRVERTPLGKKLRDGFASGDFTIPFDWKFVTSPFEKKVLTLLLRVGPGKTTTYGELAKKAGSPGAARAVGGAMRKNPLALVIPCHRVLPSTGKVGAYSSGGPPVKKWLLRIEGAAFKD